MVHKLARMQTFRKTRARNVWIWTERHPEHVVHSPTGVRVRARPTRGVTQAVKCHVGLGIIAFSKIKQAVVGLVRAIALILAKVIDGVGPQITTGIIALLKHSKHIIIQSRKRNAQSGAMDGAAVSTAELSKNGKPPMAESGHGPSVRLDVGWSQAVSSGRCSWGDPKCA